MQHSAKIWDPCFLKCGCQGSIIFGPDLFVITLWGCDPLVDWTIQLLPAVSWRCTNIGYRTQSIIKLIAICLLFDWTGALSDTGFWSNDSIAEQWQVWGRCTAQQKVISASMCNALAPCHVGQWPVLWSAHIHTHARCQGMQPCTTSPVTARAENCNAPATSAPIVIGKQQSLSDKPPSQFHFSMVRIQIMLSVR